jgi:multidrug resistance efflux pump
MQQRTKLITTGAVVLVAIGALLIKYRHYLANPWTRDGQVRALIVQIAPRVTAQIVKLPIEDNQFVHKGDLLFEIDPSDFQLAVDNARVQLDQARDTVASLEAAVRASQAQVNEAQAGAKSAQSQIGAAEADLESARADVKQAEAGVASAQSAIAQQAAVVEETQREAARARRLADQKAGAVEAAEAKEASFVANTAALETSRSQLKEAEAALAKTQAGVSQAQANLVIAQNGLTEAKAKHDTAIANLDQARADLGQPGEANVRIRQAKVALAQAELKLSWTSIYAPVDGYVTNLSLQSGDQAIANQAALALVDVNSFWIDAYFKENQLEGMAVGDQAVVTLMTYPDRPIKGRIIGIGWGIAQQDGSTGEELLPSISPTFEWIRLAQRIPVQIGQLELPDGVELRAGATASVLVRKDSTGEPAETPAVPAPRALQ